MTAAQRFVEDLGAHRRLGVTPAPFIADMSFAVNAIPAATLTARGCIGATGYAGCDDAGKNVNAATFASWVKAGFLISLVIENSSQDLDKGGPEGARQGANLRKAALALHYPIDSCVGFLAADYNVPFGRYGQVQAALLAARPYLPVLGLYGPGPLLDWCLARKLIDVAWNADALSWGTSSNAHLIQRYNDPRVAGLSADASNVNRLPIRFMGTTHTREDDDMNFHFYVDPASLPANQSMKNPDGSLKVPQGEYAVEGGVIHWVADGKDIQAMQSLAADGMHGYGQPVLVFTFLELRRRLMTQHGPGGWAMLPTGTDLGAGTGYSCGQNESWVPMPGTPPGAMKPPTGKVSMTGELAFANEGT